MGTGGERLHKVASKINTEVSGKCEKTYFFRVKMGGKKAGFYRHTDCITQHQLWEGCNATACWTVTVQMNFELCDCVRGNNLLIHTK